VADVRWFAQNDYERLLLPDLQRLGLDVATSGERPAKVVVAMNHDLAAAAWRYAQRQRLPLVSYVWDLPSFRLGSGQPDYVTSIAGRLFRLPRLRQRYTTRRGYYSRLRYVAKNAAAVWTPSVASAGDVAARFGVQAVAVPYCFNSVLFSPQVHRRRDADASRTQPLRLLSVSRLTPPKNHLAVIRAAARCGASVDLIGRGPMQEPLEALARQLGVTCRIRSGLTGDELIAMYRDASVVVCPSRFEGLGLTGIEAAMCGAPVVASDIPTHREFLGAAAHFFALDDDEGLVSTIAEASVASSPPTGHFAHLTIEAAARRFYEGLQAFA
jgi:glycosyltransferase involved in cell wall biosynthesis